jgi:2-oxoacid:acceptor oxidoreductase gamma subunit (pyruvate/2-ketoisovalerate family)
MREIRLHGRGGQGVVLAAEMLAKALVSEGKHVASFPMFGVERRGAPIAAYLRFDEKPIREKTQIYYPDCLIVADPIMKTWPAVFSGLKDEAVLILNTSIQEEGKPHGNVKTMGVVNASRIALEETEYLHCRSICWNDGLVTTRFTSRVLSCLFSRRYVREKH